MAERTPLQAPILTLTDEAVAALSGVYANARVILEYGSGGSTVLAAALPGRIVHSVESDAAWLKKMRRWFTTNPPEAELHLHHAAIGPTGDWGYPKTRAHFPLWPNYANAIWDHPDFEQPDVVLIDGRFRVACFLATLFRSKAPVTVFWDDYADRPAYHGVEEMVRPAAQFGRMVRFDLTPMAIPADRLGWIVSSFLQVQ